MKLRYLTAILLVLLLISCFGCVPEKEKGEESAADETTVEQGTSATSATTKKGGVFGEVQEQGTFPSISFDEFT